MIDMGRGTTRQALGNVCASHFVSQCRVPPPYSDKESFRAEREISVDHQSGVRLISLFVREDNALVHLEIRWNRH